MQRVCPLPLLFFMMLVAACGTLSAPNEITGNNTGGVIPAALAKGKDAQQLASAHCAKYGSAARITFSQAEAGGEVVFVCETAPPSASLPPADAKAKQAPAGKQTPANR